MKKISLVLILLLTLLCVLSSCDTTHEIPNTEEANTLEETQNTEDTMTEIVPTPTGTSAIKTDDIEDFCGMPEHTYTFFSFKDINTLLETSSLDPNDYSDKFEEYNFKIIKKNKLELIKKTYIPFIQIFVKNKDIDNDFPKSSMSVFIEPEKYFYPYSEIYYFAYESNVSDITLLYIPEKYSNTNTKEELITEFKQYHGEIIENGEYLDWVDDVSGYERGIMLQSIDGYDFAYIINNGDITDLFVIVDDYKLHLNFSLNGQGVTIHKPFDSMFSNDKEVREEALKNTVDALKTASNPTDAEN